VIKRKNHPGKGGGSSFWEGEVTTLAPWGGKKRKEEREPLENRKHRMEDPQSFQTKKKTAVNLGKIGDTPSSSQRTLSTLPFEKRGGNGREIKEKKNQVPKVLGLRRKKGHLLSPRRSGLTNQKRASLHLRHLGTNNNLKREKSDYKAGPMKRKHPLPGTKKKRGDDRRKTPFLRPWV